MFAYSTILSFNIKENSHIWLSSLKIWLVLIPLDAGIFDFSGNSPSLDHTTNYFIIKLLIFSAKVFHIKNLLHLQWILEHAQIKILSFIQRQFVSTINIWNIISLNQICTYTYTQKNHVSLHSLSMAWYCIILNTSLTINFPLKLTMIKYKVTRKLDFSKFINHCVIYSLKLLGFIH